MNNRRWIRQDIQGAVLPIVVVFMVVVAGTLALALDLGHLYLVKCELQRAADAGALAAALGFLSLPVGSGYPVPLNPDCSRALASATSVVADNQADGQNLQLLSQDVYFGRWDVATHTFTATGCASPQQVTAIKVVVRKDQTANMPVTLFFAGLLREGWSGLEVTAQAVALIGYVGYVPPGGHALPLAVDADKVPPLNSGATIRIHLNPTPGDSGCWYTVEGFSGANDMRGWINGTIPSPALQVGDQIHVSEGVADSVLQALEQLVSSQGGTMQVMLPVIPPGGHTGNTTILGFVAFQITLVESKGGEKYVEGYTIENYTAPGVFPGGPNYGLGAGLPKLVQ
jgi:hypothetical protein